MRSANRCILTTSTSGDDGVISLSPYFASMVSCFRTHLLAAPHHSENPSFDRVRAAAGVFQYNLCQTKPQSALASQNTLFDTLLPNASSNNNVSVSSPLLLPTYSYHKPRARRTPTRFLMKPSALKSMQRMCTQQILHSNRSFAVSAGPATDALIRTAKNEALLQAGKRRRTEDASVLEGTKVTKEFDMTAVFADLPTNEEAFPSIAWDFDDAFRSDPSPKPLAALPHQDKGGVVSPLNPSPSKRTRTDSNSSLVRSKAMKSLDLITDFPVTDDLFDLESEIQMARGMGEAVMNHCPKKRPNLADLLKEASATGDSFLKGLPLQF